MAITSMNFFNDVVVFFKYLSVVDLVFLVAVVILMILIITLIYFIKINNDVLGERDLFPDKPLKNEKKEDSLIKIIPEDNSPIVSEMTENTEEKYDDEEAPLLDLKSLEEKIKNNEDNERITFTEYEKDQEEKAIISYDELLNKKNKYAINYEKEEVIDDLIVKKIDLNDLENKTGEEYPSSNAKVISYQKEEEFLKALKELNSLLN